LAQNWRVTGMFAFVIVTWGFNYVFVKVGLSYAPPLWFAFLRVLVSVAASGILLIAMKTKGGLTRKQEVIAFLLGVPGSTIFFGFWTLGSTEIAPGLVSVFVYTYPLWTLFLSIPILNDFPRPGKVGAALLGFSGVVLTSQLGFVTLPSLELGAIMELVSAGFGFALLGVCFKRLFKGDQLVRANALQMFGGLVGLGVWLGFASPTQGIEWSPNLLLVLLWIGGVGTASVQMVYFKLMSRYSASSLNAYLFLVVAVALAGSFFVLGETVDLVQGVGVAAIVVAIYLVGRSDRPVLEERPSDRPDEHLARYPIVSRSSSETE
jgi:O-acetylserine/cysteine efflux transporter